MTVRTLRSAAALAASERGKRVLKRLVIATAGTLVIGTGLIGFAHTKAGRPLLAWLSGAPGCPVKMGDADPAQVEEFRIRQLALRTGDTAARSRAAADFELGVTRIEQVAAWARERGATCTPSDQGSALKCVQPNRSEKPAIADVFARADAGGKLVALDVMHTPTASGEALSLLDTLQSRLATQVGAPTSTRGERSPEGLGAPYSRTALEYRYSDYVARLSATRLGSGENDVVVRQQYQYAPAEKLASSSKPKE
jgi:hypothetical protein